MPTLPEQGFAKLSAPAVQQEVQRGEGSVGWWRERSGSCLTPTTSRSKARSRPFRWVPQGKQQASHSI